jgi:hypothetical protein
MPAAKRAQAGDGAHDVLAAEEFGVPAPDPALHREDPHDILAAEEFGVPARDPRLRHGPVALPDDPTGIAEAHDVLAAEEFALPAPRPGTAAGAGQPPAWAPKVLVALGAAALLVARSRRARQR